MADALPLMDWEAGNMAEEFRLFKQKVQLFFRIKHVEGGDQVPYILRAVGDAGLRRFNSWALTAEQQNNPAHKWKCFEEQLEPPVNFRVARLELRYYYQRPDESLDDFVTRCRAQGLTCAFAAAELNERILEQVIASTPISEFQRELLDQAAGYTLEQALELGRTHEAMRHSMNQLKHMGTTNRTTATVSAIKSSACKYCGGNHPREPQARCPAQGSTCHACGKIGHWQKVCLTIKAKEKFANRARSPWRGRSRYHGRRRSQQRYRSRDRQSEHYNQRVVHNIQGRPDDQYVEQFEWISFEAITVSALCTQEEERYRDEAFATIEVNLNRHNNVEYDIKLKVDTGAQGNTLPIRIFRRMFPQRLDAEGFPVGVGREHTTTLTAYNGSTIPCYGSITYTM